MTGLQGSPLTFFPNNFLRYNLHTIQFTPLKYTTQCFLGCSQSYATINTSILEHFHQPMKKPHTLSSDHYVSHFPAPQPLTTTNLLSITVDLPVLESPYKCNPTICGPWLASFTQHNVLKVYSYCSMHHPSLLFVAKQYPIVWLQHILFTCSLVDGHLSCFHLLAIRNNTTTNICT